MGINWVYGNWVLQAYVVDTDESGHASIIPTQDTGHALSLTQVRLQDTYSDNTKELMISADSMLNEFQPKHSQTTTGTKRFLTLLWTVRLHDTGNFHSSTLTLGAVGLRQLSMQAANTLRYDATLQHLSYNFPTGIHSQDSCIVVA